MLKVIFVLILFPFFMTAQNLDSLFNKYLELRGDISLEESFEPDDKTPSKCTFPILSILNNNFTALSKYQQQKLTQLLIRPQLDTSIVSPKGNVRIHFNLFGSDAPEYDLYQIAEAYDSVYNYEINILGFPPPPSDEGEGGDNLYDVYIQNLGGIYGETRWTTDGQSRTSPSYTIIDDDFSQHYTSGIDAAKVTAAHEFHHAVQIGNYLFREEDLFYYEITSTSMEEFVFDSINDYYAYMPAFFERTDISISNHYYSLAILNIYLQNRFGNPILKDIWEYMIDYRALDAIHLAVLDTQSLVNGFILLITERFRESFLNMMKP